jgi:hypothetical protein
MQNRHHLHEQQRRSLDLTLSVADFPDADWTQVGEKSARIGVGIGRERSDATRRARDAGLFSAVRFFEKRDLELGFWAQIAQYATPEDASSRVSTLPAQILHSHGRTLVRERTLEDERVPGVAHSIVFEQSSTGRDGSGAGHYAGGSEGDVLFVVACTTIHYGRHDEADVRWPWSELLTLAELQADKIRRLKSPPPR